MSSKTSADHGTKIETMQIQIETLVKRVADLEATLQHEHEDLVALKEVADEDHRTLRDLKGSSAPGYPPPTPALTPVGL